jgi:hypothetical protein
MLNRFDRIFCRRVLTADSYGGDGPMSVPDARGTDPIGRRVFVAAIRITAINQANDRGKIGFGARPARET